MWVRTIVVAVVALAGCAPPGPSLEYRVEDYYDEPVSCREVGRARLVPGDPERFAVSKCVAEDGGGAGCWAIIDGYLAPVARDPRPFRLIDPRETCDEPPS